MKNLFEELTAYFDRKFERNYKAQNLLLEQQNTLLQGILDYVKGPANQEALMGSIEEDGLEDEVSVGEYDIDRHAEEDIKKQWVEDGYPDEITQYLR